jgi:hypothetical protein
VLDDGAGDEIGRIALELRRPVDLGPEVDRAVMSAIRAAPLMVTAGAAPAVAPRARRRGAFGWLLEARTVRVRVSPAGALAAAGIAFLAMLGLRRDDARQEERDFAGNRERSVPTGEYPAVGQPTRTPADTVYIQRFMFVAPDAKQVAIAGDFNDWDPTGSRLVKDEKHGVWTIEVRLAPGRYVYAFNVDGKWLADPAAPRAVGDDFGRPASTVTVNL